MTEQADDPRRWRKPEEELPADYEFVEAWIIDGDNSLSSHHFDAYYYSMLDQWRREFTTEWGTTCTCLAWRPLPNDKPEWVP